MPSSQNPSFDIPCKLDLGCCPSAQLFWAVTASATSMALPFLKHAVPALNGSPNSSFITGPTCVFVFWLRQFNNVLLKRPSLRKNPSHSSLLWARLTQSGGGDGERQGFPATKTWSTTARNTQTTSQPGDMRGYKSSVLKCSTFFQSSPSKKFQR